MPETSSLTVRRTFLITDIEASTRLWERFPDAMLPALERHDALLRAAVDEWGGRVMAHTGDGLVAVFPNAATAVEAAIAAQRSLTAADLGAIEEFRVRMGVHSGEVVDRDGEYFGWALNVAARLHLLAHGGQIVLSGASQAEAARGLSEPVELVDLGLHRLRDIAEPIRVYSVAAVGLSGPFDTLRDAAHPVRTVPRALTSFVGRTEDIERTRGHLRDHPLVTLVGLAGVGKTRLALEVARSSADGFTDGVVLCEFAGVDPALVGAALAKSLGVERRTLHSAEESVVEWLHDKQLLLILDNCEDATEAVGDLAVAIAQHAPGCRMLATSREPLGTWGEQVVIVQPFDTAASDDDGVVLFLDRAGAAGAVLPDDDATRAMAQEVCDAVAGVPLAIEIAASNAASLSLRDIVDAIRAGELPDGSRRGSRHGSVDGALDLTVDRLDGDLRHAFLRCSALTGSFDREAFAAVALTGDDGPSVLAMLRGLVERSLVVAEVRRDRTRFRLLDPVRSYAEARLDPSAQVAVREAFVAHYVQVAETAAGRLRGPDEARYVAQIELDFDNLRVAQTRAIGAGDPDAALRIVAALWDFAFMRMRSEIFDWGEAALDASPPDQADRAMVLGIVALGGWLRESPAKAARFAEESLRLERELGAAPSLPVRLALLNAAEYGAGSSDMRSVMSEVITLSDESASPYWQVNASVVRSLGFSFAGRSGQALELANQALAVARESENPSTLAWALFGCAVATELFDHEHAEALLDDSLTRARSVENRWIEAMCSTRLASLRRRHGSVLDAMTLVLELFDTWERAGHRAHAWSAVDQAALCLADIGDSATAVLLHHAAATARLALPTLPADAADLAAALDRIEEEVGAAQMRRWEARAGTLDQPDALRIARERLAQAVGA